MRVTTDAVPGRVFNGKLTAINSMVDPATRNVTLQATLENPEHLLRPGMFAKVEVVLPQEAQDARHSGIGDFLCAVRRFGLCDREKEG